MPAWRSGGGRRGTPDHGRLGPLGGEARAPRGGRRGAADERDVVAARRGPAAVGLRGRRRYVALVIAYIVAAGRRDRGVRGFEVGRAWPGAGHASLAALARSPVTLGRERSVASSPGTSPRPRLRPPGGLGARDPVPQQRYERRSPRSAAFSPSGPVSPASSGRRRRRAADGRRPGAGWGRCPSRAGRRRRSPRRSARWGPVSGRRRSVARRPCRRDARASAR